MAEERKFFSRRWPYLTTLYNTSPASWKNYFDLECYQPRFTPRPFGCLNETFDTLDGTFRPYNISDGMYKETKKSKFPLPSIFPVSRTYSCEGRSHKTTSVLSDAPSNPKNSAKAIGLAIFIIFSLIAAIIGSITIAIDLTSSHASQETHLPGRCEGYYSRAHIQRTSTSNCTTEKIAARFAETMNEIYVNDSSVSGNFCNTTVTNIALSAENRYTLIFRVGYRPSLDRVYQKDVASSRLLTVLHARLNSSIFSRFTLTDIDPFYHESLVSEVSMSVNFFPTRIYNRTVVTEANLSSKNVVTSPPAYGIWKKPPPWVAINREMGKPQPPIDNRRETLKSGQKPKKTFTELNRPSIFSNNEGPNVAPVGIASADINNARDKPSGYREPASTASTQSGFASGVQEYRQSIGDGLFPRATTTSSIKLPPSSQASTQSSGATETSENAKNLISVSARNYNFMSLESNNRGGVGRDFQETTTSRRFSESVLANTRTQNMSNRKEHPNVNAELYPSLKNFTAPKPITIFVTNNNRPNNNQVSVGVENARSNIGSKQNTPYKDQIKYEVQPTTPTSDIKRVTGFSNTKNAATFSQSGHVYHASSINKPLVNTNAHDRLSKAAYGSFKEGANQLNTQARNLETSPNVTIRHTMPAVLNNRPEQTGIISKPQAAPSYSIGARFSTEQPVASPAEGVRLIQSEYTKPGSQNPSNLLQNTANRILPGSTNMNTNDVASMRVRGHPKLTSTNIARQRNNIGPTDHQKEIVQSLGNQRENHMRSRPDSILPSSMSSSHNQPTSINNDGIVSNNPTQVTTLPILQGLTSLLENASLDSHLTELINSTLGKIASGNGTYDLDALQYLIGELNQQSAGSRLPNNADFSPSSVASNTPLHQESIVSRQVEIHHQTPQQQKQRGFSYGAANNIARYNNIGAVPNSLTPNVMLHRANQPRLPVLKTVSNEFTAERSSPAAHLKHSAVQGIGRTESTVDFKTPAINQNIFQLTPSIADVQPARNLKSILQQGPTTSDVSRIINNQNFLTPLKSRQKSQVNNLPMQPLYTRTDAPTRLQEIPTINQVNSAYTSAPARGSAIAPDSPTRLAIQSLVNELTLMINRQNQPVTQVRANTAGSNHRANQDVILNQEFTRQTGHSQPRLLVPNNQNQLNLPQPNLLPQDTLSPGRVNARENTLPLGNTRANVPSPANTNRLNNMQRFFNNALFPDFNPDPSRRNPNLNGQVTKLTTKITPGVSITTAPRQTTLPWTLDYSWNSFLDPNPPSGNIPLNAYYDLPPLY